MAKLVIAEGEAAVAKRSAELDDLKITLKEKIELGDVVRIEAAPGNVLDSYLHMQGGRGVNAVLVEMANATQELAHDVAVHIGFARPKYLSRNDVPDDIVDHERQTLETISRNEGKPEAALPKIIEGRLNGFFKDVALLDQPYAKDDKQSITQLIGSAIDRSFRPGRDRLIGVSSAATPRWNRIVFKPSGEALAGDSGQGLDAATLESTAQEIIAVREMDVDVCVVVGGGNFWRGRTGAMSGMDATQSDHIGMLGTVMNAPRLAGRARARRPGHPGAERHRDAPAVRAVHPPQGDAPSRAGQGRDLRRRNRQPVLHHRHRRRAACRRDRCRRPAEGHPFRRRWRLQRRSAHRARRRRSTTRSPTSRS